MLKAQFVRQIEGEKSLEFYNCDFDKNIDSILLDRFLSGIMLGPIFERMCEESKITIEKGLEIAQSREVEDNNECHKIYNYNQPNAARNRNGRQQYHQQSQIIDKMTCNTVIKINQI